MKIKEILTQSRRDFTATLECEHCGLTTTLSTGYDDAHYHENVIPKLYCPNCNLQAPESYRPLTTKYKASEIV
jgi:hypothetical protein